MARRPLSTLDTDLRYLFDTYGYWLRYVPCDAGGTNDTY